MGSNVIFFGWDRAVPGREQLAGQHFQEFVQYLGGQQAQGVIQSFEVVFLNAHGGDLGGFFLIRGESPKLDTLMASSEWEAHQTRALLQMEGSGAIRGATGDLVMERMALWMASIPT